MTFTHTTDQIEARALAFHQSCEEHRAARELRSFIPTLFAGKERERCLARIRQELEEEAYQAELQTAEDRWYADQLAEMSDDQIAYRIAKIDEEVAFLPYRALTVNIADRGLGLADERRRLVLEQFKRSVAAGMKVAAE